LSRPSVIIRQKKVGTGAKRAPAKKKKGTATNETKTNVTHVRREDKNTTVGGTGDGKGGSFKKRDNKKGRGKQQKTKRGQNADTLK